MSDALLLGIGTLIFAVTVWATLAVGYARFGGWYDRDRAREFRRRRRLNDAARTKGEPLPERPATEISHDAPERLDELSDAGV